MLTLEEQMKLVGKFIKSCDETSTPGRERPFAQFLLSSFITWLEDNGYELRKRKRFNFRRDD